MATFTLQQLKLAAQRICTCHSLEDVGKVLGVSRKKITLFALHPIYHEFEVSKANGSKRQIEAPDEALKDLLRKLNYYLQCVYFFIKPAAAYGFIISHRQNYAPRNILTHAELHLNANYMYNVDFKDFFHQISREEVRHIFQNHPFRFNKDTAHILSKLCTHKGRLPMGSPTSPVLSNFAAMMLDTFLEKWARTEGIIYSRFVDDLTLSSQNLITHHHFQYLTRQCAIFGFNINPKKTKFFDREDQKKVTGLEVSSTVSLPSEFYEELERDLDRLTKTMIVSNRMEGRRTAAFIKQFMQQVSGKVNFVGMIKGYGDPHYAHYMALYDAAIHPPEDTYSMKWLDFPYA